MISLQELAPLQPHRIEAHVGNTPLLDLSHFAHSHGVHPAVSLFAKAEWFNPSGSVKDRAALHIVRIAEHTKQLAGDKVLLDSTSGNTGIAYAMLGASRGFRVKLTIPANASPERMKILRAYGADIELTDPLEGSDGALVVAKEMAAADDQLFYADQYSNPANWQAHYWTTATEIWEQTNQQITHFVAGLGTSGTFVGTTKRLKELDSSIVCISAEPDSPFNGLEGWKHMETAIKPAIYDDSLADSVAATPTEASYQVAKKLASTVGLFVSPSAAGSVLSAIETAKTLEEGTVVTVMADNAFKYLSERFWQEQTLN